MNQDNNLNNNTDVSIQEKESSGLSNSVTPTVEVKPKIDISTPKAPTIIQQQLATQSANSETTKEQISTQKDNVVTKQENINEKPLLTENKVEVPKKENIISVGNFLMNMVLFTIPIIGLIILIIRIFNKKDKNIKNFAIAYLIYQIIIGAIIATMFVPILNKKGTTIIDEPKIINTNENNTKNDNAEDKNKNNTEKEETTDNKNTSDEKQEETLKDDNSLAEERTGNSNDKFGEELENDFEEDFEEDFFDEN